MSLRAIFYARFHPERGPSVIHQYPPHSITTNNNSNNNNSSSNPRSESLSIHQDVKRTTNEAREPQRATAAGEAEGLFNFADINGYVIPPYEVCNRAFGLCVPRRARAGRGRKRRDKSGKRTGDRNVDEDGDLQLVTFPVSLEDDKYERNRFTFNVCFVLSPGFDGGGGVEDLEVWQAVATKTGLFFRGLEAEEGVLSREEAETGLLWAGEEGYPADGVGVIFELLRGVWQQLDAWGECCVSVHMPGGDGVGNHVLNLRLARAGDGRNGWEEGFRDGLGDGQGDVVRCWHVPVLVRELPDGNECWTWDLVLRRIVPLMDGAKHVRRIAREADVEEKLVVRAVGQLLRAGRCVVLDLWHFQGVYVLTREFAVFVGDEGCVEECWRYATDGVVGEGGLSKQEVVELYSDLRPGLTVLDFCLAHRDAVAKLDIRRFITFGVIKGFVRRQHRYCLLLDPSLQAVRSLRRLPVKPRAEDFDRAWKKAALSSGWATPPASMPESVGTIERVGEELERKEKLMRMLDGRCCLDEVCVEIGMSEKKVRDYIEKEVGDVIYLLK